MVSKEKEPIKDDLDLIEDTIGPIGRWQMLMTFVISLIRVHISWHQLGIVFLAPEPKFWCSDKNITDKCSPDCPSYEFDRSEFTETIVTEWDLVCDRQFYVNQVLQPVTMGGILVGSLVFGYISDRFGRKYPMIIATILEGITGVGAAFVPSLEAFIILKFLSTVFIGGILLISFILVMELVGKSYRTLVGVLIHIPFDMGYAGLGLLGYLIRDWHYFQMTISVTNFIFIIFIWTIPESPRWLLLVGRTDECVEVLQNAARFNKQCTYNIKEKVLRHEKIVQGSNTKAGNYLDLVRTNEMRKRTICISIVTFAVFMSYFGVGQYVGQIGNIFVNISVSGTLLIPGNILIIFVMNKIGRKYSLIITSILGGICCLLIIVVPAGVDWGITTLGALGIMFTGVSVTISYIYTGELYPTIIRSVGMGVAAMFGKMGSTIASFFMDLKDEQPWLPPTILGVVSILAALFCVGLPETLNKKLPETIEEIETACETKDIETSIVKC